jgi:hypothetical protein
MRKIWLLVLVFLLAIGALATTPLLLDLEQAKS